MSRPGIIVGVFAILMLLHNATLFSNEIKSTGYTHAGLPTAKSATHSIPFIQNVGQFDEGVLAAVNTVAGIVYVMKNGEIVYSLIGGGNSLSVFREIITSTDVGHTRFENEFPASINLYCGKDKRNWYTDVPAWTAIFVDDIYTGIDLDLRVTSNSVEKIFMVRPGANALDIKIGFDGIDAISVNKTGQLEVQIGEDKIRFTKPIAYQEHDGCRSYIDVSYWVENDVYGFELGEYNHSLPLIIDPLLASSYLGGSGTEGGDEFWWVWTDQAPDGSIYVAGMTASSDFPTTPGSYEETWQGNHDVYIVKFNNDLSELQACTYLGGSGFDQVWSLGIDESGNVYVSGNTESGDFPIIPGAYQSSKAGTSDAFVSKFSPDLSSLLASTFLGGNGYEFRQSIAIDEYGDIYMTGTTNHGTFPKTAGAYDEVFAGNTDFFVSKLDNGLTTLLASTFLGGVFREDYPTINIDGNGNIIICGSTGSADYPSTIGAFDEDLNGSPGNDWDNLDVCVSKLSNDLTTLIASTFYGAAGYESGLVSCLDDDDNIYVSGHTWNPSFPTTAGTLDEIFSGDEYHITKFDNSLGSLLGSTFLSPGDYNTYNPYEIKSDYSGHLILSGITIGNIFITGNSYDPTFNGDWDGMVVQISDDLTTVLYSTYIGGSGRDGFSSFTLDNNGDLYLAGFTNSSGDFPLEGNVYDGEYNGGNSDAVVAKFSFNQFTKVTAGPHVTDGGHSWCANWIDYDNDGYLDLFVSNIDIDNGLYHNNGDGTFTKITGENITVNSDGIASAGVTWGDYNNDGYPDVFIATYKEGSPPLNKAFANDGDGTFTEITESEIVGQLSMSIDPSWIDYNNDGLLDLFVANHESSNFLFRQDDTGFARITTGEIALEVSHSNGASWSDYSNDGLSDLFVANGWLNPNDCLFENNGDGSFTKILSGSPTDNSGVSWGGSWGDYDNDGYIDLFVTQSVWNSPGTSYDSLYQNNGDGTFISPNDISPNLNGSYSAGSTWGDFDNDGDLDLFVVVDGQNFMYDNSGDGSFSLVTDGEIVTDNFNSIGCAAGDYDRDGDLDLFVTNVNQQNNNLYRNGGNTNNWINIKCVGTVSNRSAIGARIYVKATIRGSAEWQNRHISSKTGKNSQNSLNVHFGLGDATVIDSILIEWPGGQITDILTDVPANQFLTVSETVCGDVNSDETVNILDITYMIAYVYSDGPAPNPIESADVNSDSLVNILDITYLIAYLYQEGPEPDCP